MKQRFYKNDQLVPVTVPRVQAKYHVSWGYSRGVVGICISVDEQNKTVILCTPKTRKRFANPVKWSDLRHTRANQIKDPH